MITSLARPFNQRIRITALRLSFAALIPVLMLVSTQWGALCAAVLETAGILCVIAAVLGRFWAILYIGGRKNAVVMQDGPYSVCRHPLYLFSTIGAAGFGLMLGSLVAAAMTGVLTFVILSLTAAREERYLRQVFGTQYDIYARRVPRMLPAIRLFRTPATISCDTGTLLRNASDALVFVGLIPLAQILQWLHAANFLPDFLLY